MLPKIELTYSFVIILFIVILIDLLVLYNVLCILPLGICHFVFCPPLGLILCLFLVILRIFWCSLTGETINHMHILLLPAIDSRRY